MSNRITQKQLELLVEHLNKITNSPKSYSLEDRTTGKHTILVGHYHLSGAYGGWMLARTCNDGGAIETPLGAYHRPKRELYNELRAFIRGIELKRDGEL